MTGFAQLCLQFALAAGALGLIYALRALGAPPRRIVWAAAGLGLLAGLYGFAISVPQSAFADFIMGYYRGGRTVLQGQDAFAAVLGPAVHGFVNLPIMAYVFTPLTLLPAKAAAWLWFALGLASLAIVWEMLARLARLDAFGRAQLAVLIGASGPTLYCLKEGNSGHMALIALLAALFCARRGRPLLAGALLGAMAATKLPLLLFGIYYALRGRWKIVAGGAGVLAAVGAASLIAFGWDFHLRWYAATIGPYSNHPLPAFNVQSVASFFARLQTGAAGVQDWRPLTLAPPLNLAAKGATALLLAAALAGGLWARRRQGPPPAGGDAETLEFMIVLMLACVASPLAWSHYFTWTLAPAALFLSGSPLAPRAWAGRAAFWAAAALLVLAPTPMAANGWARKLYMLGVSDYLYGALVLLALLLWARIAPTRAPPHASVLPAGAPHATCPPLPGTPGPSHAAAAFCYPLRI